MTGLTIWVVYDHPDDFPGEFIARRWEGLEPTEDVIVADKVGTIRRALVDKGLVRLHRHELDPPKIVETWL